jgi:regulatory protein
MGEKRNDGLAPVTYLPWAAPSPEASGDGGSAPRKRDRPPAPAVATGRHPAGRGRAPEERSADDGLEVDAGDPPRGPRRRLAVVGDEPPTETGVERDERIDRMIVSRLRRSSLSVAEVRATLAEHGLDEHEIEEWVERYERLGYLDDRRLAEHLVHSHGVRRGRGSGALLRPSAQRARPCGGSPPAHRVPASPRLRRRGGARGGPRCPQPPRGLTARRLVRS